MTARGVVRPTCDKTDCTIAYVGGVGRSLTQVRSEARKLAGWSHERTEGTDIDLCRWHA